MNAVLAADGRATVGDGATAVLTFASVIPMSYVVPSFVQFDRTRINAAPRNARTPTRLVQHDREVEFHPDQGKYV